MANFDISIIDSIYTLLGLNREPESDLIVMWIAVIIMLFMLKGILWLFTALFVGDKK